VCIQETRWNFEIRSAGTKIPLSFDFPPPNPNGELDERIGQFVYVDSMHQSMLTSCNPQQSQFIHLVRAHVVID
jgi:hypothetical protein